MTSKINKLSGLLDSILNLVYPAKCLSCAKVLAYGAKMPACEMCFSKLEVVNERIYGNYRFDYNISFFEYNDTLRQIILDIKFGKRAHKMVSLAKLAAERTGFDFSRLKGFDAAIPVPLHKNRLKERGFNQALVLAKIISGAAGLHVDDDICVRAVDNLPQSTMQSANRKDNVEGVFSLKEGVDIKGKNFVLIDDVFTSGETLNSLAAMLKDNGAGKVVCLTVGMAYTKSGNNYDDY